MNNLIKIILASLIFICCFSVVNAAASISTTGTEPGAALLYFGEDTNVSIRGTGWTADENVTFKLFSVTESAPAADVNINYDGNGQVWVDAITDVNQTGTRMDGNKVTVDEDGVFDVNLTVTKNIRHGQVTIRATGTTSGSADFNIFVIPYLAINPGGYPVGVADTNFHIRGVGFATDENVTINVSWPGTDSNHESPTDLNITDIDKNGLVFWGNDYNMDGPYVQNTIVDYGTTGDFVDGNKVQLSAPDANLLGVTTAGGTFTQSIIKYRETGTAANDIAAARYFDVNIVMPNGAPRGRTGILVDANGTTTGHTNVMANGADANIHIIPTMIVPPAGLDVNVTINDVNYYIWTAIQQNLISDLNAVSNMYISQEGLMLIQFNNAINVAMGPSRDFDGNIDAGAGKAEIDTEEMPEFAIDANITLYNIPSENGTMPTLAKDGILCGNLCKNTDNSTLSATYTDPTTGLKTWRWNSTTKKGDITFRVKTFSTYSAVSVSGSITAPSSRIKIRAKDGNYTINFSYSDTNESGQPMATIIYSDKNTISGLGPDDLNAVIVEDLNLLDSTYCTDSDSNIATTNTCSYDWNVFKIPAGEYWIDMNIYDQNLNATDRKATANYVVISSDTNVTVNPIDVYIVTDSLNDGTAETIQRSGLSYTEFDINFSVVINDGTDVNAGNYLASLYYSPIAGDMRYAIVRDLNLGSGNFESLGGGANSGGCIEPPSVGTGSALYTVSCVYKWDVWETYDYNVNGRLVPGEFYIDVNVVDFNMTQADKNAAAGFDSSNSTIFVNNYRPDINITVLRSDTNYSRTTGSFTIDFNFLDYDGNVTTSATTVATADIYYDTDNNKLNGLGTLIINDLNLADPTYCTGVDLSETDVNLETGIRDANIQTDNNCSYTWSATSDTNILLVPDGWYYIHIEINSNGDVNADWSGDINATDSNVSVGRLYIDNNATIITNQTATTQYGPNGSIVVTVNEDATCKYSENAGTAYGSMTNTLTRVANTHSADVGAITSGKTYYYYVRCQDAAGNTNVVDTTISFKAESSSGGGTPTPTGDGEEAGEAAGGGGAGGAVTPGEETVETITSTTVTETPTSETIETILGEEGAGLSTEQIDEAKEILASGKTSATTTVEVIKKTTALGAVGYTTEVSSTIENKTEKKLVNVRTVVEVPKSFAQKAADISSDLEFTVLKDDPIIEFIIPEIAPGESYEITYSVAKKVSESKLSEVKQPLIVTFTEEEVIPEDLCKGVNCDDNNPCTYDYCEKGVCYWDMYDDGTVCGDGKECIRGECKVIVVPSKPEALDLGGIIGGVIAVIVIIVIIGGAYYYYGYKKKKA